MAQKKSESAHYRCGAGHTNPITRRHFVHSCGVAGLIGAQLAQQSPTNAQASPKPMPTKKQVLRRIKNAVPFVARPLPLSDVHLTGGPLKVAQDQNAKYLLALEPERMLVHFRKRAKLPTKVEGYGGWDGGGRNLTGHIAGHYLSGVSLMYAATGDARFKQRADYLVSELALVQDSDGYLGALMDDKNVDGKTRFEELKQGSIRSGGFDLNGLWSPWYVEHKIYAGLRDAYRFTGNRKALEMEIKFAAWAESILANLDEAQIQKMLQTEFGGMNEVLADLYADTGDMRWWNLSNKFEHAAVRDPLARREDKLGGLHANTQVPKLMGSLARYQYRGEASDGEAASYFWDQVVDHHSFATGGHGKDEYFGPPDELAQRLDGRTDESCNVYNMLKMTRSLFALRPDIKYAEFHERALFNHVLGSMDPTSGQTCYMVPIGRGVQREYQDMFENFTCCVGSGMESHGLHADGVYYESKDKLWVNLYAPSTVEWKSAHASLTMETGFPEGETATLKLTIKAPKKLTLALRRPRWAGAGFTIAVNGKAVSDVSDPGSYIELTRTWKTGDTVTLSLPKALHLEPLPDNPRRVALLWGPLVLAGDLGPQTGEESHVAAPVLVAAERPVADWLKRDRTPVSFRTDGIGRATTGELAVQEIRFTPFYRLHKRTYAAYWDCYTPKEWDEKAASIIAEQKKQRMLEEATVGFVQPGMMQAERDSNQQGEDTTPDRVLGRPGRRARKWFSFDLPVDPSHPMTLVVTYSMQEFGNRTFDVLVDGQKVAEQSIPRRGPGSAASAASFFDVETPLPASLVANKKKVTVRFQATQGKETAAVFGIRMIRADAPR